MKYILVFFVFLSSSRACLSQENYSLPVVNGKPFALYMEESFRNNFSKRLDTLGLQGFCWIKFSVGIKGDLKQVETSPGTHPVLSAFLKETIQQTNGLWKNSNNEWLILPVRYTLQHNGRTNLAVTNAMELDVFLSGEANTDLSQQYIFLPVQEYVSPFDGIKNSKMKLVKE